MSVADRRLLKNVAATDDLGVIGPGLTTTTSPPQPGRRGDRTRANALEQGGYGRCVGKSGSVVDVVGSKPWRTSFWTR